MRIFLLFQVLFLFAISTFAQISVGTKNVEHPSKFNLNDWAKYKTLKTYFVIRESDKKNESLIRSILQDVWKFNSYEIIDFDQYKLMPEDGGAIFFGLRNYNTKFMSYPTSDLAGRDVESNNIKIELWRNLPKGKYHLISEDVLAYMIITSTPDFGLELRNRKTADAFEYICKSDVEVQEWGWGFIKNILQEMNRRIIANEPRWEFQKEIDKDKIHELKSEILYVPSNIDLFFEQYREKPKFETYAGKEIIFLSPKELSDKILKSGTKFYYLQFHSPNSGKKVVSIINSVTGEYLYTDFTKTSPYFSEKDISILNSVIK